MLEQSVRRYRRPLEFYTDKAGLFLTTPKKNHPARDEPLPPTYIGRALNELGMGWIGAHSPQAKGRVERSFQTAQDRLVKGLDVAGAKTLEQANAYLESEYFPEWEKHFTVVPARGDDAHLLLRAQPVLEAILCRVDSRVIADDYTIGHEGKDVPDRRRADPPQNAPGGSPGQDLLPWPDRRPFPSSIPVSRFANRPQKRTSNLPCEPSGTKLRT